MKLFVKQMIVIIGLFIIVLAVMLVFKNKNTNTVSNVQITPTAIPITPTPIPATKTSVVTEPISDAKTRVTKKPFWIYITPTSSPVQPEKFTGYHTGVDFEVTSEELTQSIPVYAICDGKILVKKWVNGYGGVIIQSGIINGENVTVLYGHLNINENGSLKVGSNVKAGERLAILGTAYSNDTNGERKHLHLGIHKGSAIEYLGYVQNKNDLSGWLDSATLL